MTARDRAMVEWIARDVMFLCPGEAYDENLRRAICEAICTATGFEWKGDSDV